MTTSQLQQLYKICETPLHVQAHMKQVAKVATIIAKKITRNGHRVNIKFTQQLALIHDLMKAISFDPSLHKKYHGIHDVIVTSEMLKKQKEKDLARAVLSQQFDAIVSTSHPLKTLEEIIVYYADKRVAHTKIVSLTERFEEGNKRYGKGKKSTKILSIEKKIFALEKDLSCMAGEDLSKL